MPIRLRIHGARIGRAPLTFWAAAILLPTFFVMLAYILFNQVRDREFFESKIVAANDRQMALSADTLPARAAAPAISFLDIDDRTLLGMDDPVLIPPAIIARTLATVSANGPKAIFVDLDFAYLRDEDELEVIRLGLTEAEKRGIPVLLARAVLPPLEPGEPQRYRETPLDAFVDASANLMWVGVVPTRGSDQVFRGLPPIQSGTLAGQLRHLPAPPLALDLIRRSGSVRRAKAIFDKALSGKSPCGTPGLPVRQFCVPGGAIPISTSGDERVRFTLSWPPLDGHFDTRPAWAILDSDSPISSEAFKGRIVVLGSTAGYRDVTTTPLGEMPGAYLHANAIRAWLEFGPTPQPRFWPGLTLVFAITAVSAHLIIVTLRSIPERLRPFARWAAPPVVTVLFWTPLLVLPAFWDPSGLIAVVYVATAMISLGESRLEKASAPDPDRIREMSDAA